MRLTRRQQEERVVWSVEKWNRMNFVTVTLPEEEHDPKVISRRWTAFIKALKRWHVPDLRAVRVLQDHPGGHGWHIHALLDRFIPHSVMLSVARECGLGRINFKMVSGEERKRSVAYVVRYICRDMRNRWKNPALKGVRLLTASGSLLEGKRWWVRLCDCTVIDTGKLARQLLQAMLEISHAGNCVFRTWRGVTIPVRMIDLLQLATPDEIDAWQRECAARMPDWLAE